MAQDRLTHEHLFHEWAGLGPPNLRAESQHIPAIAQHDGAVHRGEPTDGVRRVLERPITRAVANQLAEPRERWRDGVGDRDDRLAPRRRTVRHHQQRSAVPVRAHRQRERQQHVVGIARGGVETEQRRDEVGALGREGAFGVYDLDHLALEHCDVGELAVGVGAPMLNHEQARLDHFHHKTERRDGPRRAPDGQVSAAIFPDAEVNAGPFDGRRELGQVRGIER